jgi:ADP-dependent phosphofructokinase/glucokinase
MSWDHLYRKSIDHKKTIDAVDNVLLGYNMDVDRVTHVTQEFLDSHALTGCFLKEELYDADEFFSGLCHAMTHGGSEVWAGKDLYTALHDWDHGEERMGGQSGIMANTLSFFDIEKIVVYCGHLSENQATFFRNTDNIQIPSFKNGIFIFKSPKNACESIEPINHFVFEYKKGHTIDNHVAKNDDRFIVSCPHEFPDEIFADALDRTYEYAVLSGFHLFHKKNIKKNIKKSQNHIKAMRARNEEIKIHYEATSMYDPEMRTYLVKKYLPSFDSLGMNGNELTSILDSLGYRRNESLHGTYQNLLQVKETLGLTRVHLHDAQYHLSVIDRADDPQRQRDALLFASLTACAKAKGERIPSLKAPMEIALCANGCRKLNELGDAVGGSEFAETGILEGDDHVLIGVPTTAVERPECTVGLGDTVACLSFVGI